MSELETADDNEGDMADKQIDVSMEQQLDTVEQIRCGVLTCCCLDGLSKTMHSNSYLPGAPA